MIFNHSNDSGLQKQIDEINQSLNVKYDVGKDMLQIYYNGEWVDWKSANLQWDGTIFGNGAFSPKQPITHMKLSYSNTNNATCSFSDGFLVFFSGALSNGWAEVIYNPNAKIDFDMMKYTSITIIGKCDYWESTCKWELGFCDNIPSSFDWNIQSSGTIFTATGGGTVTTKDFTATIPLENITGEKYLCVRNKITGNYNRHARLWVESITFNV